MLAELRNALCSRGISSFKHGVHSFFLAPLRVFMNMAGKRGTVHAKVKPGAEKPGLQTSGRACFSAVNNETLVVYAEEVGSWVIYRAGMHLVGYVPELDCIPA